MHTSSREDWAGVPAKDAGLMRRGRLVPWAGIAFYWGQS